jgi:hypothetical protein
MSLGMQPTSYVSRGTENLTRNEQWQAFQICFSVVRNTVASSKNYIRMCKLLLLIVIAVYNPNAQFV